MSFGSPLPVPVPWLLNEAFDMSASVNGNVTSVDTFITYGSYVFNSAISFKFQVEPVYGDDRIIPKYYKHTFTVETVLTPHTNPQYDATGTQPLDLNESQARRDLSIPGLPFYICAKGVGQNQRIDPQSKTGPIFAAPGNNKNQDPVIDGVFGTADPVDVGTLVFRVDPGMDLNYGPRPVVQILEPIGASRVYRLVWSVEVCLPICCVSYQNNAGQPVYCLTPYNLETQAKYDNPITEFVYDISWSIDELGYSNRTISGSAEIAGRLLQDMQYTSPTVQAVGPVYQVKVVNDTFVKNMITTMFPYLKGFKRTISYDVGRDAKRLDWRIVDTELKSETPYYKNVIDCNATVSLRSQGDEPAFTVWDYEIKGTFTVVPGASKYQAYLAFLTIVKSKLTTAINVQNGVPVMNNKGVLLPKQFTYLPVGHSYEEDVFGRSMSFDFRYRLLSSLENHLVVSEMFVPVRQGGNTWDAWLSGIPNNLKTGQGAVNFNLQGTRNLVNTCNFGPMEPSYGQKSPAVPPEGFINIFTMNCPPPEKSWLEYKNWYEIIDYKPTIQHVPSYNYPNQYYQDSQYYGGYPNHNLEFPTGGTSSQASAAYAMGASDESGQPTVQKMGAGKTYIVMKGYALRYCYQIKPPMLYAVKIAGVNQMMQPIQVSSRTVLDKVVGQSGKVRLIFSSWEIVYTIPRPLNPSVNFIKELLTDAEGEQYISQADFKNIYQPPAL